MGIQKKNFLLQECSRRVSPQERHVRWLSPCQVSLPGPPATAVSKPASAGGNEPSGWVLAALWHSGNQHWGQISRHWKPEIRISRSCHVLFGKEGPGFAAGGGESGGGGARHRPSTVLNWSSLVCPEEEKERERWRLPAFLQCASWSRRSRRKGHVSKDANNVHEDDQQDPQEVALTSLSPNGNYEEAAGGTGT